MCLCANSIYVYFKFILDCWFLCSCRSICIFVTYIHIFTYLRWSEGCYDCITLEHVSVHSISTSAYIYMFLHVSIYLVGWIYNFTCELYCQCFNFISSTFIKLTHFCFVFEVIVLHLILNKCSK